MTPEEKFAADRLADDLANLLSGVMPTKLALLDAPMLNWWRAERCKGLGWPTASPKPFYLVGVFDDVKPALGSTIQATGAVYWMAHDLTWCQCADCWYRLGKFDDER